MKMIVKSSFFFLAGMLALAHGETLPSSVGIQSKVSDVEDAITGQQNLANPISVQTESSVQNSFLEGGVEYPFNIGTHLKYYFIDNVYTRVGFSWMPEFFMGSFAKLMPYFGLLDSDESAVISYTFQDSLYTDIRFGWFPYSRTEHGGPYMEIGASGMFYGKGIIPGLVLDKTLNANLQVDQDYSVKTNTVNGTFHIGYQVPFERIKLNFEIGAIKIMHIVKPSPSANKEEQRASQSEAQKLPQLKAAQQKSFDDFLVRKGWIFPTISILVDFPF